MAYSDLIDDEGISQQFLAVVKPRRLGTGWTLDSGSVYKISFDHGHVSNVEVDGDALTEASSSSLSAGEFYYDFANEELFVRTSGSTDPSSDTVVIEYELYFGTFDAHINRDPTDDTTRAVYFEPVIKLSPNINQNTNDVLFGFLPVKSANIVLTNAEHILEKHLYDSSFNLAPIKIYHWLDDLVATNIKLVFDGLASDIRYKDSEATIRVFDRVDTFNTEYRNPSADESFYSSSDFSELDPNFLGRPIRYVYGVVDGFVPANIDYKLDSPTTSDNRTWAVMSGQSNLNSITATVPASPSSTTTRTYLSDAKGFRIGDSVHLDRAVGTDEYKVVTDVDYSSDYIEHSALSGGAMATGDSVKRSYIGIIEIIQEGVKYQALFGRDYTEETSLAGGAVGFSFTASLETNLSMNTLSPNNRVSCRVYGKTNNVTLGGGAFGSDDSEAGNLTHPVVILFDLLINRLGLTESQVNTSSFTALETAITDAVGFAIPSESRKSFPTFKELLIDILKTILARFFLDNDLKWEIKAVGPLTTEDKEVADDEIIRNSISYDFSYRDILSDVIVEYAAREQAAEASITTSTSSQTSASSDTAKFLHKINKQKTFKSLHFDSTDAATLASRIRYALGDRRGLFKISTKNRFFDTLLGDIIEVQREKLPGFSFDEDTTRERDFAVIETNKSLSAVDLILDDQKGIEDNSGSW